MRVFVKEFLPHVLLIKCTVLLFKKCSKDISSTKADLGEASLKSWGHHWTMTAPGVKKKFQFGIFILWDAICWLEDPLAGGWLGLLWAVGPGAAQGNRDIKQVCPFLPGDKAPCSSVYSGGFRNYRRTLVAKYTLATPSLASQWGIVKSDFSRNPLWLTGLGCDSQGTLPPLTGLLESILPIYT